MTTKVHALQAENIKKLKAVSLELNGGNLCVAGKPGQGKTTAINLLWMALSSSERESMPVTEGQSEGTIKVTLSNQDSKIIVTRKFKDGKTTVKCAYEDGKSITVADIKSMLDERTFDPLEFYKMTDQERVSLILKVAGVDLQEINKKLLEAEEERKLSGKIARGAEEELQQMGVTRNTPVKEVDITETSNKLAKYHEHNQKINKAKQTLENLNNSAKSTKDSIATLEMELKAAKLSLEETEARIKTGEKFLEDNKEKDTSELIEQINNASKINKEAAQYKLFVEQNKRAEQKRAEFKESNEKVAKIKEEKKNLLINAKWPLKALGVDEDCKDVLFNGVPIKQQGVSKMTAISFAIISKLNPELKVCRFDGAESLGEEGRKTILKIAEKQGIQVFMSRVTDSGAEGNEILIEDGEVKQ